MTVEDISSKVETLTEIRMGENVTLSGLDQVINFMPSDQLVEVYGGILLSELNEFLRRSGYEIPLHCTDAEQIQSVSDLLSENLDHQGSKEVGTWRDWVVRMTIILASGKVVQSGANVVKNVTGFDLHKLMIGARYSLGIPVVVTLRIRPCIEGKIYSASLIHRDLSKLTEDEIMLMKRTKALFDPSNKLNPGAFGFI